MEQHLFGIALGASSLLAGWLLHNLSKSRSEALSYLQDVPKFTDLGKLRQHLNECPDKQAEVLVQGEVKKLGSEALKSEKASTEGAARLVTTTIYRKVYNQNTDKWTDSSSTIENVCVSVPFSLVDRRGNSLNINSVTKAGGFRLILERVWQNSTQPDSRSIGDFATNLTLKEIPNGTITREYLLVFGSTLGAHGVATLQNQSLISSGTITLVPTEVSASINGLIARNEMVVNTLKFLSMLLLIGGGSVLIFALVPMVLKAIGNDKEQSKNRSTN